LGALVASTKTHGAKKAAGKRARIVSFRDAEGFRFRLLSAEGDELLLSNAFADPKRTGEITRALLAADAAPVTEGVGETRYALLLDGARIATSPEYADALGRDAAIATLMAALESLRS
jgi:tryptophanyl-tRNA synthetase